jgi:hypothetical protein
VQDGVRARVRVLAGRQRFNDVIRDPRAIEDGVADVDRRIVDPTLPALGGRGSRHAAVAMRQSATTGST